MISEKKTYRRMQVSLARLISALAFLILSSLKATRVFFRCSRLAFLSSRTKAFRSFFSADVSFLLLCESCPANTVREVMLVSANDMPSSEMEAVSLPDSCVIFSTSAHLSILRRPFSTGKPFLLIWIFFFLLPMKSLDSSMYFGRF